MCCVSFPPGKQTELKLYGQSTVIVNRPGETGPSCGAETLVLLTDSREIAVKTLIMSDSMINTILSQMNKTSFSSGKNCTGSLV